MIGCKDPGYSHSNKWYVAIVKRVLMKIKKQYPDIQIIIRADSGFSCPAFYKLADDFNLQYAIDQASNEVLKQKVSRAVKAFIYLFIRQNIKHQYFTRFQYQAQTWRKP